MECSYKDSKWAWELIELQQEDGSWGYFHTLSEPEKYPYTTEQALRRLGILGYDFRDEVIQKAVAYMRSCLAGETALPDRREKTCNWDLFTNMMLSAWILRFNGEDDNANRTAAGIWEARPGIGYISLCPTIGERRETENATVPFGFRSC